MFIISVYLSENAEIVKESQPEKVVDNLIATDKVVENLTETVETELKPEEIETENVDFTNDDVISEVRAVPSIEPRLVDTEVELEIHLNTSLGSLTDQSVQGNLWRFRVMHHFVPSIR